MKVFTRQHTRLFQQWFTMALALVILTMPVLANENASRDSASEPSDPYFSSKGSWGQPYDDQWALKRIGFSDPSLWPSSGEEVLVAVVDSGVDYTHPELKDVLWRNEDEIPNNGIDDDKNGYVDDVMGWNFVENNNNVRDDNGHGTLVSGIIAAKRNDRGITGVNPWAKIMPVKITTLDNSGDSINLAKGIFYAVDNGAKIINISVGGKQVSQIEKAAVEYARKKGVLIVAASGNDGKHTQNYSPGGLPGVLTVASTELRDKRVNFSNWGPQIDIAAPGVDILSLRANGTDFLIFERQGYKPGTAFVGQRYYRTAGSSFSAPLVTGVASLILSQQPELQADALKRMVLYSARDIEVPGKDQYTGYGFLDAAEALKADPNFFVDAEIMKVKPAQTKAGYVLQVHGKVTADQFKKAWLELGEGQNPQEWKRFKSKINETASGLLVEVPTTDLRGVPQWTFRLITEHANGKRREARFNLKLQ